MKIKKKELRRGLAQLPINYPDPDVLPEALPDLGGLIDLDREMVAAETLCKQLGHNEASVRNAVLDQVPIFLDKLLRPLVAMEKEYEGNGKSKKQTSEIESVRAYFAAHPATHNPYFYHNLLEGLQMHREKVAKEHRLARQRESVRSMKQQQAEERRRKESLGRYGESSLEAEAEGDAREAVQSKRRDPAVPNEHRQKYSVWIQSWADVELVLLKLCRGLFFCLWHSDKPLDQLACADVIASLIQRPETLRGQVLLASCLFRVLSREWPTIDHYRMDKYLALVRRALQQVLLIMRRSCGTTETKEVSDAKKPGQKRVQREEKKEEAAVPSTASMIANQMLNAFFPSDLELQRVSHEVFFFFQRQVIPNTCSVGLTMHLCDVAFDELEKAFGPGVPAALFTVAAAGIPLFAMSQGNYVEKRVLDHFFPPIASGVLASRRATQLSTLKMRQAKGRVKEAEVIAIEEAAQAQAHAETQEIVAQLVDCCQRYAVSRGTVRVVRVMFSEAEMVLRQTLTPELYEPMPPSAMRRRIQREIDEVNEVRRRVVEERTGVKEAKRGEKRKALLEKVKARRAAMLLEDEEEKKEDEAPERPDKTVMEKASKKQKKAKKEGTAVKDSDKGAAKEEKKTVDKKAIIEMIKREEAEAEKSKKKLIRSTKRKKNYVLTKEDLYGGSEDDE